MRRALVLLAAVALTGCADRERAVTGGPSTTTLQVTVYKEGRDGPAEKRTVSCPGDAACDQIREGDLEPLPADTACTKIYGGPAEATVRGSLRGRGVNVAFSLSGGCEIDRWRQASYLLGDPPGQ